LPSGHSLGASLAVYAIEPDLLFFAIVKYSDGVAIGQTYNIALPSIAA